MAIITSESIMSPSLTSPFIDVNSNVNQQRGQENAIETYLEILYFHC